MRRFFSPVGKALAIWLKISYLPGNHDSSIPGLNWNRRAKVPVQMSQIGVVKIQPNKLNVAKSLKWNNSRRRLRLLQYLF